MSQRGHYTDKRQAEFRRQRAEFRRQRRKEGIFINFVTAFCLIVLVFYLVVEGLYG